MKDFVTQFEDYMAPTKASNRFVTFTAISMISAALERKVWYKTRKTYYPNFYMILTGRPGCGKTFIIDEAEKIIQEMNKKAKIFEDKGIQFAPKKLTPAALILKYEKAKKEETDGYKHASLFSCVDELSFFIKEIGGGPLGQDLLLYYDCKDRMDKSLVGGGDITIENQYLTSLWGTTPDFLQKYLLAEMGGEGLSSRFFCVTDLHYYKFKRNPPPPEVGIIPGMVDTLFKIHKLRGQIYESPEASEYGDAIWDKWMDEKAYYSGTGPFAQFFQRKYDMIIKTAMCLCAARLEQVISLEDLQKAERLVEQCTPDMRLAFGVLNITNDRDSMWSLLQFIPMEGIYEDEMFQKMSSSGVIFAKDFKYQSYLDTLSSGGFISISQSSNGKTLYKRIL